MKILLVTLISIFSLISYGQEVSKECKKCFKRQKANKSTAFSDNEITVTTKNALFYEETVRTMAVRFHNTNGKKMFNVLQNSKINLRFKQPLNLSTQMVIALIFDDSTIIKLSFPNGETNEGRTNTGAGVADFFFSENSLEITDELSDALLNKKIKTVEVMNPYANQTVANSNILVSDSEKFANKLQLYYKCFHQTVK